MLTLSAIQTQLIQSAHVHLNRYQYDKQFIQQPNIPRKPRVTIPTSKQLLTHNQHKHVKHETFYELPEGINTEGIEWKCNSVGSQPILELPKELRTLFSDNELYTTQYDGNTGVWYAVLFALDPEFITRTLGNQEKCVNEVKQQMSIELDDYFQKYKYRQYGYMKSDMDRILTHSDEYHTTLGHYFTDFLDINVLVLLENKRFHWLGRFDESRVTTVLYRKGISWYAIAHPDQKTHLWDVHTIQNITHQLGHESSMDATHQHANLVMDVDVLAKVKREIKAMKIKELQDRAQHLELHIRDENGKKKLKKQLQEEVFQQLTGFQEF